MESSERCEVWRDALLLLLTVGLKSFGYHPCAGVGQGGDVEGRLESESHAIVGCVGVGVGGRCGGAVACWVDESPLHPRIGQNEP